MDQRKCPECGESLPEDALFCTNCGIKVSNSTSIEQEEDLQEVATFQEGAVPLERDASSKEPRKKPSRKMIIIAAVSAVIIIAAAFTAWFLINQHNKQVWEQEHQKYSVNIEISAKGYDPATSTPIPVHIEGADFEGNTVSEDHLIGTQSAESLSFMRGTYSLTVVSSPITSDGTVYNVPDVATTFEITGETAEDSDSEAGDNSAETTASVDASIVLDPMDSLTVTNEYIESIATALINAGMDETSVQQFKDAAMSKVQQAVEEQRRQEIMNKIEELEAEYTAADNYIPASDPNGGATAINEAGKKSYEKWDGVMNDIYDYLASVLPESEAAKLASDQADWEDYCNEEMEKARQSGMGSAYSPSFMYVTGSEEVANRARVLLDRLHDLV